MFVWYSSMPRFLWVALVLAAGCFSERTDYKSGELQCGPNRECPRGFTCASDTRCRLPGDVSSPDAAMATMPDAAACNEGDRSCQGLDVFVCRSGAMRLDSTCGNACLGGYCTECKPTTLRCNGSQPQSCSESGTWTSLDPCPADNPQCDQGTCVPACGPAGTLRCSRDGTAVEECDQSGQFVSSRTCANVCLTSPEPQCGGVCRPGAKQCGPDQTPQTCTAEGKWKDETACAGVCVRGQCDGECRPGSSRCAGDDRVESCGADARWTGMLADCTFVCNPTTGKCDGECEPGATRCEGTRAERCGTDAHYALREDCGAVPCTGGECKPCTEGTTQCNAGIPQRCAGGVWTNTQAGACSYLCDATRGCVGSCSPGSTVCVNDVKKTCGADAEFASEETCSFACVAGECTGVCRPTTKRCNGSSSQTCNSTGQWAGDTSCAFGCDDATGDCKPCTPDAMSVTCPAGACGDRTNNCGTTVTCPACTETGASCGGGGVEGSCGCTPESISMTCQNGQRCTAATNNCGQSVVCPNNCMTPQSCGGGTSADTCGCTGKTKAELCAGKNCGNVTNECGVMFSCWPDGVTTCAGTGQSCGGGNVANVCGCTAQCTGKMCGGDGCGGSCGTCNSSQTCNGQGQCVDSCMPISKTMACMGKNCGDVSDGCSGIYSCWPVGMMTCAGEGQSCGGAGTLNVCGCSPQCTGKVCGPNSCGGTCGPGCPSEKTCSADQTMCECKTAVELCGSRNCGQYTVGGCTVSCGPGCSNGQICDATNMCRCHTSDEFCAGKDCASNEMEGSCGPYSCDPDCSNTIDQYDSCHTDHTCRCDVIYDCSGVECGPVDNGCGGSHDCGGCGLNADCVDGMCIGDICGSCCGKCCCGEFGCELCSRNP